MPSSTRAACHRSALFVASVLALLTARVAPAQVASDASLQITVQELSPPALRFSWPLDPTSAGYAVQKRIIGSASWGASTSIPGGGSATNWTDSNVLLGIRYEYKFLEQGTSGGRNIVPAALLAQAFENRGALVLLVDATKVAGLGARLDRLVEDLVGDGWSVLRHDVSPTASVPSTKALIAAEVAAHPGQVKSVFLLGHVPVPYSGQLAPDGHPDHNGAWPADCFYGELDGLWTDSSVNTTAPSRQANWNVPGDGRYDQTSLPSDVDLAVGRVDFANLPSFALGEADLLAAYLDKDHDYRHKVFAVEQRGLIDDNFGWFSGEAFAASGWRNFSTLLGPTNIVEGDYFATLNTPTGNGYAWSYGCGGGTYTSCGGVGTTADFAVSQNRCVFTMMFGSYFGDWDVADSLLRAPLAQGWTLASCWAGRPHWSFHLMALGETIGAAARRSQNDTDLGGFGQRYVHLALMGDPTLRQHVVAPPATVQVTDAWPQAIVGWTASTDPIDGYHVYRAANPAGPFTRLTSALVTGTSFVDSAPLTTTATYMVRARRVEVVPTGSYHNLSQGAFVTVTLPQQAASHAAYGSGCYTVSDSLYAPFADPAAASAALSGTALTFTPTNGSYVASSGGTFVPPGAGATALALGDDDQIAVPLSQLFPYPGSFTTTLYVHSNGIVAVAPLTLAAGASGVPDVAALLAEPAGAFYAWHDFDPAELGSGPVLAEEVGGTLYVTWNGVESKPAGLANPSTLQFQCELASGVVRIVWGSVTANGLGAHLVGWSPGGASLDAGPLALGALPWTGSPLNLAPLGLTASPPPVSSPTQGTLVTYTVDHVPEAGPGSAIYFGVVIISFTQDLAGSSLAGLGMPGCALYTGSLDLPLAFAGNAPTETATLAVPAGLTPGLRFFATAAALVQPNSLPNGQNAFGAVTSNGIASFVNAY